MGSPCLIYGANGYTGALTARMAAARGHRPVLAGRRPAVEGLARDALTALAPVAIVERVLAWEAPPGFQTPSLAYGPDFVLAIEGVTRTDE